MNYHHEMLHYMAETQIYTSIGDVRDLSNFALSTVEVITVKFRYKIRPVSTNIAKVQRTHNIFLLISFFSTATNRTPTGKDTIYDVKRNFAQIYY